MSHPVPAPAAPRTTIRWGIIGCGDVTEIKSGPGFQKALGSQLVAVMRRNGTLAADYARRHGVPRSYDDARALVADPEVDAVYVATPPGVHLDGALLVAAAGKPCYMEKPMARHTAECDAMIAAFAQAKQKLFVAYYRRAMPRFLRVQQLLADAALGRLTGVNYRFATPAHTANPPPVATGSPSLAWRLAAENSGGGLILDVGSHALDILDFLLGPLENVAGHAARLVSSAVEVEDAVALTFRTATAGIPGAACWNFSSLVKEDALEFTGTAGRLTLSVFGTEPLRLETTRGLELLEVPTPAHVAQPLIQLITDELLGRGTCPSTGESARRTTLVMDRVLDAYYGGRTDAFWTRPATWPGRIS